MCLFIILFYTSPKSLSASKLVLNSQIHLPLPESARTEGVNHHTWRKMVSKEMKQMWARERERQTGLPDICAVRREGGGKAPSTCEDQTQKPRRGVWMKSVLLTS